MSAVFISLSLRNIEDILAEKGEKVIKMANNTLEVGGADEEVDMHKLANCSEQNRQ